MMDPDHRSVGSKGNVTLTLHLSKPWAMDSRQWSVPDELEVGVIVQLHQKGKDNKMSLTP
jgi:hypothetical protein